MAAEKVSIGAIRWDAWFGDAQTNPYIKNLSDKQWHGRLPFYARVLSDSEVEIRGDTQEAVDSEIAYARAGGIDYWAFLYYSPSLRSDGFEHDNMNLARRLFLSSKHKNDLHFCLIVYPGPRGNGQSHDAEIGEWISMMREPNYQTVADGRPLLYLMFWGEDATVEHRFGSAEKGREYMDLLRDKIMEAGLKNPYLVALSEKPEAGAAAAKAAGLDAISAYTSWGHGYAGQSTGCVKNWNGMMATGNKVVPNLVAGWGGPRDGTGDAGQPKPGEIGALLRTAYSWIDANPAVAEAKTVLFYAWNEIDEGGWLVPDKEHGTAKLDEIRKAVDECQTGGK